MFVSKDMIEEAARRYGQPKRAWFTSECTSAHFDFIRSTQKRNRAHDVTLYVVKGEQVVVNAKHFYPQGMFRAPSGGLEPGESFEDGIARELTEETGCRAAIERFLLIARVTFVRGSRGRLLDVHSGAEPLSTNLDEARDTIAWTSYVFQLKYIGGDFAFTDHREIREVSLANLEDFERFSRFKRDSDNGGLHYRAALHDTVKELLVLPA
jgi:ADP-ribose pyrophosphatase YjhB (NUDIX family)